MKVFVLPKSQQVILAILLVLIGFNIFLPIIVAIFKIEILYFPKLKKIILTIFFIFISFYIFLTIIGAIFKIEILEFGLIFIKVLDSITLMVAIIFVYRQIKRKGF